MGYPFVQESQRRNTDVDYSRGFFNGKHPAKWSFHDLKMLETN